jgi:hypothetical protein
MILIYSYVLGKDFYTFFKLTYFFPSYKLSGYILISQISIAATEKYFSVFYQEESIPKPSTDLENLCKW